MSKQLEPLTTNQTLDRPGHWHKQVGRRGLKLIEELAARGCSLVTIAKALRMTPDTFRNVRRRQPEVDAAFVQGRAKLEDGLASNLVQLAYAGNVVANIFALKGMCGWRDNGEPREGTKVNVQIINLPDAMSEEAYRRMLDVTPKPQEPENGRDD